MKKGRKDSAAKAAANRHLAFLLLIAAPINAQVYLLLILKDEKPRRCLETKAESLAQGPC